MVAIDKIISILGVLFLLKFGIIITEDIIILSILNYNMYIPSIYFILLGICILIWRIIALTKNKSL